MSARVGRYVLGPRIGGGAHGVVYRGTHSETGQSVAVKILRVEGDLTQITEQRFRQEAQVTARLSHPNTVRVFDFGRTNDNSLYLVMELLRGQTVEDRLRERFAEGRAFSQDEVVRVGVGVCRSLAEAHAAGLIHRDLKPDNLFLHSVDGEPDPLVKVLDFGVAKLKTANLTTDKHVPGTPAYMSPEQITGAPMDDRSDLYSLGAVLYAMLSGDSPFAAEAPVTIIYNNVHRPVAPITEVSRTPITPALADLIHRLLQKSPSARPTSAVEVKGMLLDTTPENQRLHTRGVTQDSYGFRSVPLLSRSRLIAAASTCFAIGLAGGVGLRAWGGEKTSEEAAYEVIERQLEADRILIPTRTVGVGATPAPARAEPTDAGAAPTGAASEPEEDVTPPKVPSKKRPGKRKRKSRLDIRI